MNILLDSKDIAFRDEVRAFIAAHLTPQMREAQARTSGSYPPPEHAVPWQRALDARGWLAPLWPEAHGGTGWSGLRRFIFENECARVGAPLIHPMGVRFVGPVLIRFGTPEQQRRFLPRILRSEDYWCQGFSEPNAGSDLANLALQARRDGDHYVLQGMKTWTTHAQHANWMFALVRTARTEKAQDGISFLLVDMRAPGITVRPIATIGGDPDVNEVFFDAVRVPVSQRVGEENQGWECARYLLEFERGAGVFTPRLRAQLRRAARALTANADVPADQVQRFGALCAGLDAFEWLEMRTLAPLAPGQSPGPVSSLLKLRASRLRQDIARFGFEALGSAALPWRSDQVFGAEREDLASIMVPDYFNSRAYTIFGGTAEIQLNLIARAVLAEH